MKKTSIIMLLLITTAGCGGSLKNKWTNFSAHYNTFYNAKEDFNAGLKKVKAQPVTFSSETLVRPHAKPALAGRDNFNSAINNGAQILRRFPGSKWVDDALLLIGKSYYYLQENFLAIQKFEELIALPINSPLKQRAVIWKGRTLLDIHSYAKGVQFLKSKLNDFEGTWNPENKAEAQIVLAEHLAMLQQWAEAASVLELAIDNINDKKLRGRSYLLLGQLLQKQHEYSRAFRAYSNVPSNHPDYAYVYQANLKKAEVSRLSGNSDLAVSIFLAMLNDDKNFDKRNELYYQLAQTYKTEKKYRKAEAIYHKIVANQSNNNNNVLGDVYYQLGRIYSEHDNDYELAAAYFDSSSQISTQTEEKEANDAQKLSSAYDRYVSMKHEIARIDSLLKLGSMDEGALNARLVKIRQLRRETLQNSQNAVQQTNNTLFNAEPEDVYGDSSSNAASSRFGFLNYHNQEMVQRNRQQFEAIWGNRPLVDNWRRREALSGAAIGDEEDRTEAPIEAARPNEALTDKQMGIDVDEIPKTDQAREKLIQIRLKTEYRLGSLFFLTLNRPDSAAFYYQRILQNSHASDLEAQTLYSLYELYNLQQKTDSATVYKNKILATYPHSRYGKQILNNDKNTATGAGNWQQDSTKMLRKEVQRLFARKDTVFSDKEIADTLRYLAIENKTLPVASAIFFQGIRKYIHIAKRGDSLQTPADSLLAVFPEISDSSRARMYSGAEWDSVRKWLADFKKLFPQSPQTPQVNAWLNILNHPEQSTPVVTCKELEVKPFILPGKEQFVNSVSMPDKLAGTNISGHIRYRFLIAVDGNVQSYKLLSNPTHLGIEEAYRKAIENTLHFKPITQNGKPVRASCEVEFPVKK